MQIMFGRVNVISRGSRNSLNFKIFNLDELIKLLSKDRSSCLNLISNVSGREVHIRVLIKIELRNLFVFLLKDFLIQTGSSLFDTSAIDLDYKIVILLLGSQRDLRSNDAKNI